MLGIVMVAAHRKKIPGVASGTTKAMAMMIHAANEGTSRKTINGLLGEVPSDSQHFSPAPG